MSKFIPSNESYTDEELEKGIAQVRDMMFQLFIKRPFYALMLYRCEIVATRQIETAGVSDKGYYFVNLDWFMGLTLKQQRGLSCHEALHLVLRHGVRRGDRDAVADVVEGQL